MTITSNPKMKKTKLAKKITLKQVPTLKTSLKIPMNRQKVRIMKTKPMTK